MKSFITSGPGIRGSIKFGPKIVNIFLPISLIFFFGGGGGAQKNLLFETVLLRNKKNHYLLRTFVWRPDKY